MDYDRDSSHPQVQSLESEPDEVLCFATEVVLDVPTMTELILAFARQNAKILRAVFLEVTCRVLIQFVLKFSV